jgi:hypothetical protein
VEIDVLKRRMIRAAWIERIVGAVGILLLGVAAIMIGRDLLHHGAYSLVPFVALLLPIALAYHWMTGTSAQWSLMFVGLIWVGFALLRQWLTSGCNVFGQVWWFFPR